MIVDAASCVAAADGVPGLRFMGECGTACADARLRRLRLGLRLCRAVMLTHTGFTACRVDGWESDFAAPVCLHAGRMPGFAN